MDSSTKQQQDRDDAAMKAGAEREDRRKAEAEAEAEAANRAPVADAPAGPSDTMPPLTPVGEKRLLELQAMDGMSHDQQMELDRLLGRVYDAPADADEAAKNTARAMTPIEVARLRALHMMNSRTADENAELDRLHEMAAFSAGEADPRVAAPMPVRSPPAPPARA